ncbi:hypothetical protein [Cupriavidus consociatus]|uniref:hypothetical protein n=1 Tax=Cupriavidus consociatus TaxID=2821357 RepID=UPI001AE5CD2D|nr:MULTISPECIES: hypothetical protein [unclassified Cupriavidus]MBP0622136.1 hypothetical protein [Cupriavidus sp. LEh25]MDK2658813.1 hypothetical protein [Cupriavidus sp. LEh21]
MLRYCRSPLCLVVETRWLIPRGFDGFTPGPLILLRPGASEALIEHEKVHVRQFWRSWGLMGVLYLASRRWRLRYEVEAYREQLRYSDPESAHAFARVLAQKYRLKVSEAEAYRLLMQCPEATSQ